MSGTVFDYTNLAGAQLIGLQFETPPSFSQVDVGLFNGNCTTFKDTDLRNAHLTLASTTAGCETSPLLPGSTVPLGLLLSLRYYIGANPGASGQRVIANVNVNQARFVAEASNRSSLAGLDLSNMNLSGAQFIGWPLDLSGTRLDGANLAGVTLDGAELSGATFHNVNAAGASFQGARLAARGNLAAADFSGSNTNLQKADFVDADVSGAKFGSADISGAVFDRALARGTDFNGVRAKQTSFAGAHIYGDGEAFDNATDLSGADFSEAVLAGDVSQDGGFNLTRTNLTGAHFDYAQCIGCNFTGSNLDQATFTHAYLIGAVFATVTMQDTNLYNAWLYCGDVDNSSCASVPNSPGRWTWPLALGVGEVYGPVPFGTTDVTGLAQKPVKICPDGTPGANDPGCAFRLLPDPAGEPPIPAACSAVAYDACPAGTTTVFDATDVQGKLLSVAPMAPPVWATALGDRAGYAIGLDDGTLRHVGGGSAQILAGRTGNRCPGPTQTCGDGGPASQALLGSPAGLAIGLDGSLYIADSALHRVRKIDPSGNISTVAGTGQQCTAPAPTACGNGGPASAAQLTGPYGVWIDPLDRVVIADGRGGLRQLARDGVLSALPGTAAYDVRSVVGDATGTLYAAAHSPADYIIQVAPASGQVSVVVGTGTSGYNSNTDPNTGLLQPGTSVQINAPGGLSVDLSGNILFADSGNNLVRAYVPSSGFVIDDLGGMVTDNGTTQGGFNGDCRWADQTELASPISVSATSGAWVIVADAGNARLRMLSPSPLNTKAVPICPSQSDTAEMLSHGRGARRLTTTPTSVALPVRTPSRHTPRRPCGRSRPHPDPPPRQPPHQRTPMRRRPRRHPVLSQNPDRTRRHARCLGTVPLRARKVRAGDQYAAMHREPGAPASFGEQLRISRARAGLAQEALAVRAGLGIATIKALERDQRQRPHPHTVALLADALGLTPEDRASWLESQQQLVGHAAVETRRLSNHAGGASVAEESAVEPPRLPVRLTSFVGREIEVETLRALLDPAASTVRLLTLLGPGGIGKTRLAVAAAAGLAAQYPDGVVFVDLAPLSDARLLPATIARALELRERGGLSARELLLEHLRPRRLLLVLDNFEHLLDAAPLVADILQNCLQVTLLTTSRAALRLSAERRMYVGPLSTQPADHAALESVAATPAVRLFVERAQVVAPELELDHSNASAIAAVCQRLEGIPLAIELAAARCSLLRPAALLQRLERRLRLLTRGATDLPQRQQTLRHTLDWSYGLLGPAEQVLFRRLAVFAGGCTVEAAEAVCAQGAAPAEDLPAADRRACRQQPDPPGCRPRPGAALRDAGDAARVRGGAPGGPRRS